MDSWGCNTATNRIHLVLFDKKYKNLGPYVAAINRMLISAMMDGSQVADITI
jgi:hypothetical protein